MHRFIPAMSILAGARYAELKVTHHARRFGKSKYGLSRVWRVLLDVLVIKMLTAFSTRPLHWFGIWSVPFFALALLLGVQWFRLTLGGESHVTVILPTITMLMASVAIQLLCAGVLAELVVHEESNGRIEPMAHRTSVCKAE
jgi:hypothetical protein